MTQTVCLAGCGQTVDHFSTNLTLMVSFIKCDEKIGLKTDVVMDWSLWMSQSIMPKDWFCCLHGQGVPCMSGRVWLVSHCDSLLEPQMRAGVRCGPKVDKRLLESSSTRGAALSLMPPTPQGNDLSCVKRSGSWSDLFSVNLSVWPGQKIVSIQLLLRWDLSFVQLYLHYCSHSLLACNPYLWQ